MKLECSLSKMIVSQSSTFNSSEGNGLPGDVAGLIRAEECHHSCTLIRFSHSVAGGGGGGVKYVGPLHFESIMELAL